MLTIYPMPHVDSEKLGPLLTDTARSWRTKLDQRLKPMGLSQAKWMTLIHLARGADALTQKEIAARIGIEEPTLAGLLDRLQEDGWIKRKNSPHDRRCKTVHLQRGSNAVLGQIFDTAHELRNELLAQIPKRDLATCMSVLETIRKRADAAAGAPETKLNGRKAKRKTNETIS